MAKKTKDNSKQVLSALSLLSRERLIDATLTVEREAKELCPVRTGTLRRSIFHDIDKDKNQAMIGSNVEYAPYVELGTHKWEGKPFLRPALERSVAAIKRIFGR